MKHARVFLLTFAAAAVGGSAIVASGVDFGQAAEVSEPAERVQFVDAPAATTVAPSTTVAPTTVAPATTTVPSTVAPTTTIPSPIAANEFSGVTSPNTGDHCIADLNADTLDEFWSGTIGAFQGGDYQRAHHLGDGRILWTFQDAFIGGNLIHNTAFIQSGNCFTPLSSGNWLFAADTWTFNNWYWIFDGGIAADGTFHMYVANMVENGNRYLANATPTRMYRVILDVETLTVIDTIEEPIAGLDLYGWSVTSDAEWTYLLSHCYRQFGFGPYGHDACVTNTKIARIPLGDFAADRTYWDGTNWVADPDAAINITDNMFTVMTGYGMLPSRNNPVQVKYDGEQFHLVSMPGDWFGNVVFTATADSITGPWTITGEYEIAPKCDDTTIAGGCNTYYASWVPWTAPTGEHMFTVGNNTWNGSATHSNLWVYRPNVFTAS